MSSFSQPDCPIVSTQWLEDNINNLNLKIIDATWFMPDAGRNAKAEYENCHIEGAVFFDIDDISDEASPYPHMMPAPEKFASRMRKLGVGDGQSIVIYDALGIFSAPRAWWMFRYMGHKDVVVLDGGLKKWLIENRKTTNQIQDLPKRHFNAFIEPSLIKDYNQTLFASRNRRQIIDARSAARFSAEAKEPRKGLKSGHIPNSKNLHYDKLITSSGTLVDDENIRLLLEQIDIDLSNQIISTCGSGITACIIALALAKIGKYDCAVYDGSWAQWGAIENAPISVG